MYKCIVYALPLASRHHSRDTNRFAKAVIIHIPVTLSETRHVTIDSIPSSTAAPSVGALLPIPFDTVISFRPNFHNCGKRADRAPFSPEGIDQTRMFAYGAMR
jgi:hypothetical protein